MKTVKEIIRTLIFSLFILGSANIQAQVENPIADQAFDAFNNAFLVQTGGLTYYKEALNKSTNDYFWMQALDIETAEDAYFRTKSETQKTLISNLLTTFNKQGSSSSSSIDWSWNDYNDDLLWAVLAYLRGYEYTGKAQFLSIAKYGFNLTYYHTGKGNWGWDTKDGGIWWRKDMDFKSPLSNSPAVLSACYLYEFTGQQDYLDKAKSIYQWTRDHLYNESTGEVWSELYPDGRVKQSPCIFNNGAFGGAANYLYQITGEKHYYDDAKKTFDRVMTNMCSNGVLAAGTRGGTDIAEYLRYFGDFVRQNYLWNEYYFYMKRSANAAWSVRRKDLNIAWNDWTKQMPIDDIASVIECNSSVVMQQVTPVVQSLPDTIEAEDFNFIKGIEVQANETASKGKMAGSIANEDWLEYIVKVPTSGLYTISYWISGTVEGSISLLENGKLLSTTALPSSGHIQTFTKVTETVNLTAGIQSLKLVAKTGGWNLDKWSATLITPSLPGIIQAEKYTRMSGVQKETTSDLDGGQDVGYIEAGDWMDYSVTVPLTGTYRLSFRVAGKSVGTLALKLGEETLATTSLFNTGDWQNWATVTTTAQLTAGTQTYRLYAQTGGWNINWWSAVEGVATPIDKTIKKASIRLYPNPVTTELTVEALDQNVKTITIRDYSGRMLLQQSGNRWGKSTLDVSSLAKGIYIVTVVTDQNQTMVSKFVK